MSLASSHEVEAEGVVVAGIGIVGHVNNCSGVLSVVILILIPVIIL